ncbi:MAG: hypothetical protein K9K62_06570 [Desulfobacteraceae bacterium]|nr:hypothetical protein [Desulfobacteraceae bacterium]
MIAHWASTILSLLTLMGVWALIARRKKLEISRAEKAVLITFAAYFVISACFMLLHGILPNTPQPEWKFGHEARMLAFVPMFYLFLIAELKSDAFWYGI